MSILDDFFASFQTFVESSLNRDVLYQLYAFVEPNAKQSPRAIAYQVIEIK